MWEYTKLLLLCCLQLTLTSHVSPEDFQLGYTMTGTLERSDDKYSGFQTTHLAFVRRRNNPSIQGGGAGAKRNKSQLQNGVSNNQVHPTADHSSHWSGWDYLSSPKTKLKDDSNRRKVNLGRLTFR